MHQIFYRFGYGVDIAGITAFLCGESRNGTHKVDIVTYVFAEHFFAAAVNVFGYRRDRSGKEV